MNNEAQEVFFELLRIGLWGRLYGATFKPAPVVNWNEVYQLAEEQSAVGLVAAGIEVLNVEMPLNLKLQFVGATLQMEQRNRAMNQFIERLVGDLRKKNIYILLVKGQGIAQCYERPLWRTCGDIDLLISSSEYEKAKRYLTPAATAVDKEETMRLHLGMTLEGWIVELHGTLLTVISRSLNKVVHSVQNAIFLSGEVRSWENGKTMVYLPSPGNDAFLVFAHILEHFYVGGIGLRQICDWCRLLWTYRETIDVSLLEKRLREAKVMTEWKGFAAFAIDYLRMPLEAMPFYEDSRKWHKKAKKLRNLILETGNFGHNKDESYRRNYSKKKALVITFRRRVSEYGRLFSIFPSNASRIFVMYVLGRVRANLR